MTTYDLRTLLFCVLLSFSLLIGHIIGFGYIGIAYGLFAIALIMFIPYTMWLYQNESAIVIGVSTAFLLYYLIFLYAILNWGQYAGVWVLYLWTLFFCVLSALISPIICEKYGKQNALRYTLISFMTISFSWIFATLIPYMLYIFNRR